ncbi:hypothetical protein TBLA_0F00920 [Henningerozyma blattae CBS 6284]|uniref:Deacetylase sirtuin-type domain-containing protein n=1 Tax=Henningerozyma blattae (strain ATCC 34711 / CBS 6284 / DSM 70876 / NBRC 10599 / NRRL Y-10934 / UCD 77-7) TaxID=1071380 RepID=I2H5I4_HENB6|nr:hypothetical protein TBLA_0F00920 [Tetrapisispora blattae CBS 6284]CCH61636.1 hypothetical protein TBLA_0F00920 [Tetrapisispora blattae CBS 6284]
MSPVLRIGRNAHTGKYILPPSSHESTEQARTFLKTHGLKSFLDAYLPEQLTSIHIYCLIRLLGFEIKNRRLLWDLSRHLETPRGQRANNSNSGPLSSTESASHNLSKYRVNSSSKDPLSSDQLARLIRDLQKAINRVLSMRLPLSSFSHPSSIIPILLSAKNIIVLTGAGVSTSLGIPDFRSSEGFYSRIRHLGLDDPQDVFSLDIFRKDPSVFYSIAHLVLPPQRMFSPLHAFIKLLQDRGSLLRNYTQNIDNFESHAGVDKDKLVQCHGSFATATCFTCGWKIAGERIYSNIRKMELPLCPHCIDKRNPSKPKSFGVLKPDITFFGESLPSRFHSLLRKDLEKCDLLLCIGTSLKVAPVSDIPKLLNDNVPRFLINRDPVSHGQFDINLLGLCDDTAVYLSKLCNWKIPCKNWQELASYDYECIKEPQKRCFSIIRSDNEYFPENNKIATNAKTASQLESESKIEENTTVNTTATSGSKIN